MHTDQTDDLDTYRGFARPVLARRPRHRGAEPTFADLARARSGNPRHLAAPTHR